MLNIFSLAINIVVLNMYKRSSKLQHASNLNRYAWRRSIEWEEDPSCLVRTRQQANLCRLQKSCWRRKFFHGPRRLQRKQITSSNRAERRHTRQRLRGTGWRPTWAFGSKIFISHSHQIWTPTTPACGQTLRERLTRQAATTQMSSRLL